MIHKTVTRPRSTRSQSRRVRVGAALATAVAVAATVAGCGTSQSDPAPPGSAVPGTSAEPAALTGANVNAWLDGLLPAALARTGVAGASVAVVRDGETLTARGYGHADTGGGDADAVPVDPDRHLFRVGSVSKLVTATAALQLVQSGKLQLDTDIGEYLDFTVPRRYPRDVTLRHLLTHTAGFEERIAGLIGTTGTDVDLRTALINDPPEQIYEPGTVPAYSNYGNALAGYLVERASGIRFEEYVASNVLARAGMASSTFEQPLPAHLSDRMSNGYERAGAPAAPFEIVSTPPAGALSAPATDMARFMLAQLGEQVGEAPLLDAPTRELMQRPALDATSLGTLAEGPRMTLGYFDESRNGHRILGHGGDTLYFHSHLQLYPDDRTGIYLSLNSTGEGALDSHELRQAVLNGFADRYFPAEATQQVAGTQPVAGVDPATAAEHAALAAGTYESSRAVRSNFLTMMGLTGRTTVSVTDGDRLLFEPAPLSDSPALYEEVSPWVWREVGGQRTVAMRVTDGQVEAISFDSAFALLPVPAERDSALVLTVLVASTAVLLLVALSWPVRAIVRRRLGRAPRDRAGRTARILTRVAVAGTLLALAGWTVSLVSIMGLRDVSATSLRVVQLMQLIGLLGVLPAAVRLIDDIRRRTGWHRITGSVAVLLALAGTGWFAVEFMLLAPSISY
ncbi:beta-lactamase family protein [Micromonospora sp. C51]|uniref:serine hydrolase domain-containing protein n=1 Tax=Micromonospora sp. C51 TaxID=2824879 RepID=UPI001B371BE7|nr:serine hydrolase domain-containing protein [Micromonospora sp. C51]MBQ1047643.1 beta-lactamase family protein [Micromonospora sp. C51]